MHLISESTEPTALQFADDINNLIDEGLITLRVEDGEIRLYESDMGDDGHQNH